MRICEQRWGLLHKAFFFFPPMFAILNEELCVSDSDKCCQRQFILFTSATEWKGEEERKALNLTHSLTFIYGLHAEKNIPTESLNLLNRNKYPLSDG